MRVSLAGRAARPSAWRHALSLVGFALLVLGLVAPTAPARAASAGSPAPTTATAATPGRLHVQITSTSPTLVAPDTDVTVTGRVVNRTTAQAPAATVVLNSADQSLNTRTLVDDWYESRSPLRGAVRIGSADIGALAPGAAASFSVTVPADLLPGAGRNRATLPLQAEYTGTAASDDAPPVRARSTIIRTSPDLTWSTPLQVSWMVPLTLPADARLYAKDENTRLAGWRAAIGPGSRIDTLLTRLEGREVTWLLDPSVLSPVLAPDDALPRPEASTPDGGADDTSSATPSLPSTPSAASTPPPQNSTSSGSDPGATSGSGATPSTGSSTPSSTTGAPTTTSTPEPGGQDTVAGLVSALRTRLQQRSSDQPIRTLPVGDPDLAALADVGSSAAVEQQLRFPTAASTTQFTTGSALQWPTPEVGEQSLRTTTRAWNQIRGESPTTVLSTGRLDGRSPSVTTSAARRLSNGTRVLAYDESLTAAAAAPDAARRTPRVLAESLAAYLEAPETRRSVLVLAPRDITEGTGFPGVVDAAATAPWLAATPVGEVITAASGAPATARLSSAGQRAPAPVALTAARWDGLRDDRRRLRGLNDLLVDSQDVIGGWSDGLAQRSSMRWRGHAGALDSVAAAQHRALVQVPQRVFVRPSSINFFTDSSDVGVLVVNQLNRPVHNVQLRLAPRRYVIEVEKQAEPIQIAADSRASARVSLRAVAAGQVRVDARLNTTDGMSLGPADAPAQLSLNVRPTGSWMYWALGLIAGPVLLIGVYRTLRRAPRPETEVPSPTASAAHDAHDDPTRIAPVRLPDPKTDAPADKE